MAEFFRFENITYHLGASDRQITVSSALEEGSVLMVKGPSGSGKSTLLRILARLQAGDDGQVYFQGVNWLSVPPPLWRSKIHYVAQKPAIFSGTVLDNLRKPYELKIKKEEKFQPAEAERGMELLLLGQEMLKQDARTLSGGEAARIALLRSVLFNPNILLLDEPTAALDDNSREAVRDFLIKWLEQEPQRGIVLVSHRDDSKKFTRVKVLEIEGPSAEVN